MMAPVGRLAPPHMTGPSMCVKVLTVLGFTLMILVAALVLNGLSLP